jgi:prolyl 4-hydroxylase
MGGCYTAYGDEVCDRNDEERIAINAAQPAAMRNYTSAGYAKVEAPAQAFRAVRRFWERHDVESLPREKWDAGNIYTNHWEAETKVLPIGDLQESAKQNLVEEVQTVLERWSGVPLIPTSLYGIRVYTKGSILAPHVDRYVPIGGSDQFRERLERCSPPSSGRLCSLFSQHQLPSSFSFFLFCSVPLVISAIINVAQDVDEPWPLEVIGRDGIAVNITMDAGDMVLYESHSILHGRPFALKGRYYANLFLHYEPVGFSAASSERRLVTHQQKTAKDRFEEALARQEEMKTDRSPHKRRTTTIPQYLEEGSIEASRWRQEFVFYRDESTPKRKLKPTTGVTSAHILAARGDLSRLREVAAETPEQLNEADSNGWKPIHEAARAGRTAVLEFLLEQGGVDVNERTNDGEGATPLWWAEQMLPEGHEAIALLRRHGGVAIPAEEQ